MMAAPKIRFKGFSGDWVQRKLGDVAAHFEYGLNASAKDFDGTHKYIRITDIDETLRHYDESNLTSPDIDFTNSDNYMLKRGDILFARTGASVGKTYIHDDDEAAVYFAGFLIRARIYDEHFPEFIYQSTLTEKYNIFIKIMSQRSGQPGVNAQEYASYLLDMPSNSEQTAIGNFFRTLDDTIALYKRKLDGLKKLKNGYLQQMFPQAGERVPRVRFAGFSGDWEIRLIEDIAHVGTGNKDTQDAVSGGEYDFYVRSPNIEKINSYSFDGEAVLTVGDGVGVGKVFHYANGKFDYHQRVYKISDFNGVYGLFFYHYFSENFINESRKYNAKTSVDSVRREMITKMEIPCPIYSEQTAIGNFFRNLDEQIAAQQTKLDKLKQLKMAYLQGMFV